MNQLGMTGGKNGVVEEVKTNNAVQT
jgi:hypothetical protein